MKIAILLKIDKFSSLKHGLRTKAINQKIFAPALEQVSEILTRISLTPFLPNDW